MAWDYVHVYSNPGLAMLRDEFVARSASRDVVYLSLAVDSVRVRLFGDGAVVTCVIAEQGTAGRELIRSPEGDSSYRMRSVRVYIREDGMWRAVHGQHTTIRRD